MLLYASHAVKIIADPAVPFDTLHTYLPLARAFLENPGVYFSLPNSVMVAPGAVIYMAFWDADPITIKSANLFLGLLSLVLASDAARRIAGAAAGVAAAWAFALSPMLVSTGITLMGEAPFVFLVVAWLWACAYTTQEAHQSTAHRNMAVVLAAVCLAAATLTRGTWLYWLPAASLAGMAAAMSASGPSRTTWLRLAIVHMLALLLVGAFMARQYDRFERPLIATGSGAALYFGSNAILHGYEPPFFGLAHDEFTVTDHLGHLSLEGDRRLTAVTRLALGDTPLDSLSAMYLQKLGAILFFSRAHLGRHVLNERAMRIALLVLALAAFALGRKRPMVWMLAGALTYQCAVHIPVMYNPRYSFSALDPSLTLLAAAGFGLLTLQQGRARRIGMGIVALMILVGIGFGAWHQRWSTPTMPDVMAGPHQILQEAAPDELSVVGSQGDPFKSPVELPAGNLTVTWKPALLKLSGISVLDLEVPHLAGTCSKLWLVYNEPTGASRTALVRLSGLRTPQHVAWGMNAVQLPDHQGNLQLRFECDPGTVIALGKMGLFDVSLGRRYRSQAIGSVFVPPNAFEGR